jgi:hypothetical protein
MCIFLSCFTTEDAVALEYNYSASHRVSEADFEVTVVLVICLICDLQFFPSSYENWLFNLTRVAFSEVNVCLCLSTYASRR